MALQLTNGHILYYHMDSGSGFDLFHSSCLFSDPRLDPHHLFISGHLLSESHMFTIMLCHSLGVGYTPLGIPCDNIMAIVDHSDAA